MFAGLEIEEKHATAKPININKYISELISSPKSFAPRRAFNPFAGSGGEILGVLLSGQYEEIIGVELIEKHINIANQRLKFWSGWAEKGLSDPKEILKTQKKIDQQQELIEEIGQQPLFGDNVTVDFDDE